MGRCEEELEGRGAPRSLRSEGKEKRSWEKKCNEWNGDQKKKKKKERKRSEEDHWCSDSIS